MTAAKRIRWQCPAGLHPGELGSSRPPRDALVRYCLPCSIEAGRLVARVAPALERRREAAKARQATARYVKSEREEAKLVRQLQRETERFTVQEVDLRVELHRYSRLPVFGRTFGRKGLPDFTVTRRDHMPNRQGFASPWDWRIHMTLTPVTTLSRARKTLVHELVHLHVGRSDDGWHGVRFRRTLNRALTEAGLREPVTITEE